MGAQLGSKMGKEIADMLGLKHARVITIRIPYDDVVEITVEALLDDEDGKLTGYMQTKRYELNLIDEEEPEHITMKEFENVVDVTTHTTPNAKGEMWRRFMPRPLR